MSAPLASRLNTAVLAVTLVLQPTAHAAGWSKIALDYGLTSMKLVYGDPKEPCDNPGGPQNAEAAANTRKVMGGTIGLALGLAMGGSVKDGAVGASTGREALDRLAAWSQTLRSPEQLRDAKVCVLLRNGRALLLPAVQDLYRRYGVSCGLSIRDVDINDPHAMDSIQDCLRNDPSALPDLQAFHADVVLQNSATCRAIRHYIAAWTAEQMKQGYGQGMLTTVEAFCPVDPK